MAKKGESYKNDPQRVKEWIRSEKARWQSQVGSMDPYLSKVTVGIHEVLQAHYLLVEYFAETGEGIGGIGPRDIGLLHSALARQFVEFGGTPKWKDRLDICATLMYGLIKNHPFHDANKRTAFLVSLLHLQKIGRTPTVDATEFEDFTVNVADNKLNAYHKWNEITLNGSDKDVALMSWYLKRSTRTIDLKIKQITYDDLNGILRGRGLRLDNPKGNRIDLVRVANFDETSEGVSPKRIAHIGFHGWSRQVSRKDIEIVRNASRLDARHGYDSQAFFNGMEDVLTLIKKYREPLERLAFR